MGATGSSSFGYFGGGGPGQKNNVYRVDYSNDTASTVEKGSLTVGRQSLGATSARENAFDNILGPALVENRLIPTYPVTSFGYFGGGNVRTTGPSSTPAKSSIDRINFNNDTVTGVEKGSLSVAEREYSAGATNNSSFGYVAGGYSFPASADVTSIDRIDFNNDTATSLARGPLSAARKYAAATGSSSFGYFGGGNSPTVSTVDRLDYSSDTSTASPKGPLTVARNRLAATGNQSFGYFAGGWVYMSTVDRIDYSNDTATAAAKGFLHLELGRLTATGNGSFGYFGSGYPSRSTLSRVDYSNDTATGLSRGPLASPKERMGATGNASFGYFTGGDPGPSPSGNSQVHRLDYTNDTNTAVFKGPMKHFRLDHQGMSAAAHGLPQ